MHVMPVQGDKAVTSVQQFQGSAATSTISIDDVMLQARLLAGALGMDLALLGFADQLAGGLGEGGFFRTSVQAAERSDIIRTALTECFNHVVDVHTLTKYGWCFDPGKRPYAFNFFGATSALDREQQETRERAMNAASVMVGVMEQLRQMGMPEADIALFLKVQLQLDEDYARQLAKGLANAKPADDGQGFGGGFGPAAEDDQWCTVGYEDGKHRLKDPEAFGEHLRREGIMLRRTRAEVGRELPALTKITVEIEHDQRVLERYKSDALRLAQTILQKNQSYKTERMEAAGEFDRLMRQACGIAKAPYVADFVRMLVEEGRQVLLFGWHRDVYRIWLDALADLNPVMYTGSESAREKQAAKEAFVAGTARVIIISVRAGAGVDGLQAVSATTVHGELDWSPGVIEQNIGRVHRDGQPEPVQAYFPVCSDDFDQVMLDVLGVKREQIDGVISPDDNLVERLDIGQRQLRDVARRFLLSQGQAVPEDEEEDLQPLPQVLALPGAMPAPATEPNARQEVLF
ncbi:hypothetical protein BJP27_23795 (plasmid) [Pseudomonas oryzihabitans]|nr:hypothetical protein BJP27_23795 [Pseudomonas psychrotolerans]